MEEGVDEVLARDSYRLFPRTKLLRTVMASGPIDLSLRSNVVISGNGKMDMGARESKRRVVRSGRRCQFISVHHQAIRANFKKKWKWTRSKSQG